MTRALQRLALALLAAFGGLALLAGYWAVVRQTELLARTDNPRRLLLERRYPRGAILDRHGLVLAEAAGQPGDYTRFYPYPALGPVLGYVSPVYGTAGVEAAVDALLHGEVRADPLAQAWDELLGRPPQGRAVRLTLDLRLQRLADEALDARAGAVIVLNPATGELLALASHPGFDANTLETDWPALVADARAPLLNRATAALYQPGNALQPALLAAALQAQVADLAEYFPGAGSLRLPDGALVACATPPPPRLTLAGALAAGCPGPFAEIGRRLGAAHLQQLFSDLRLLEAPQIGLPTVAATPGLTDTAALAAGQGALTITPLHLALVTAALAQRGQLPAPQLIQAQQQANGEWRTVAPADHAVAAFTPEVVERVQALVPEGYAAQALADETGRRLAWFAGFTPGDGPRYVVVVLLEAGPVEAAAQIGRGLLTAALTLAP